MKTIKYKLSVLSFLLLISCESGFLDETPYDFLSPANFYKTKDDALAAVTAAYSRLKDGGYYQLYYWMLADGATDQMTVNSNKDWEFELNLHTFVPTSRAIILGFEGISKTINAANVVIKYVPDINMDENLKNRLVAEAKFLRALAYYNLAGAWGGVPLVTDVTEELNPQTLQIPRASQQEVFNQVIMDLEEAELDLPISYDVENVGRATKGAAKALMARTYLYMKNWELAAKKAKEVMDMGVYDLFVDYQDVWDIENENGIEHIFSVQRDCALEIQSGTGFHSRIFFYAPRGLNVLPGGEGADWKASLKFYNAFPNDYRKDVTFLTEWTYPDGTVKEFSPTCWKYYDPNMCGRSRSSNNDPVLRYADVLLIYAEAVNELNGPTQAAYEAINKVRRRARGVGTTYEKPEEVLPDLENLTKDQFRNAVYDERNWELCFEGIRRYDLVRTDMYQQAISDYLGREVEAYRKFFPIPLTAIEKNPALEQNSGY